MHAFKHFLVPKYIHVSDDAFLFYGCLCAAETVLSVIRSWRVDTLTSLTTSETWRQIVTTTLFSSARGLQIHGHM